MKLSKLLHILAGATHDDTIVRTLAKLGTTNANLGDPETAGQVCMAILESKTQQGHALNAQLRVLDEALDTGTYQGADELETRVRAAGERVRDVMATCLAQLPEMGRGCLSEEESTMYLNALLYGLGYARCKQPGRQAWTGLWLMSLGEGIPAMEALGSKAGKRIVAHLPTQPLGRSGLGRAGLAVAIAERLTTDDFSVLLDTLCRAGGQLTQVAQQRMIHEDTHTMARKLLVWAGVRSHTPQDILLATPQHVLDQIPQEFSSMEAWLGHNPDDPRSGPVECLGILVNVACGLEAPLAEMGVDLLAGQETLGRRLADEAMRGNARSERVAAWKAWGAAYNQRSLARIAQDHTAGQRPTGAARL